MTERERVAALQTMLREVERELDRLLAGTSSMPDAIEVLAWIQNGLRWQLRDPAQYVAAHGGAPIDAEVTRWRAAALRR